MTTINKGEIKEKQLDRMSKTSTNLKRYEEMLKKFSKYSLIIEIALVLVSTIFAILNYINENSNSYQFSIILSLTLPISLVYLHLFHNKNDSHYNVRNAYLQIDGLFSETELLDVKDKQFDCKFELICLRYQNAISKTENVPTEIYLIEKNESSESNIEKNKSSENNIDKSVKTLKYKTQLFLKNMGVDLMVLVLYFTIYWVM